MRKRNLKQNLKSENLKEIVKQEIDKYGRNYIENVAIGSTE